MFLTSLKLQEYMNTLNTEIIQNFDVDNFGEIGYDVRIKDIIIPATEDTEDKQTKCKHYDLPAGDTVFVSTVEDLKMPNNLVAMIIQRNSIIRSGLLVEAPLYQPGHHTKMFFRVTNISKNDICLRENEEIAMVVFAELSGEVNPYKGTFVDEFDFKNVGTFDKNIPKIVKVSSKIESIENIEKRLYEKVAALLTVFIGIFSLFNLNIQILDSATSPKIMFLYNLVSIGGLGLLVSFIGFIINKKHKTNWWILGISLVLLVASFVLVFPG